MENIHKQFVQLGRERNKITYELLALLPEIFEKRIFRKYGCATIEEYAGKFAGLSKSVVQKRLRLEKDLENMPALKETVRTQGVHKVALVAKLARPETEKAWADKVQHMSKQALQELSKEIREKPKTTTIELNAEMTAMLMQIKKKLGVDNDQEVMRKIFEKILEEEKIPGEKSSRYISQEKREKARKISGGKCAYPHCDQNMEVLHHRERFAKSQNHSSIIPLCRNHHEFAHNGLIENEREQPEKWKLRISNGVNSKTDQIYRKIRSNLQLNRSKQHMDPQLL